MVQVFSYVNGQNGRRLQLIVIFQEPIEFIVTSFYGTHVMNVADWKGAYCLFPHITLEGQVMYLFHLKQRRELLGFDKYIGRGFSVPDNREVVMNSGELKAVRRVGDSFSRKLCFSGEQLAAKDLEGGKRRLENFQFRFDGKRMRCIL